jgi:hypothetical protein
LAFQNAGGGGGIGGQGPEDENQLPPGNHPPPLGNLPQASLGPIARAIWAKVPAENRHQHAGQEMVSYTATLESGAANPESLALAVATTSVEPMCFLTSRENSPTTQPRVQLITTVGIYVVALGSVDELHGHSFAFVGEQSDDQLPSTFLEPATNMVQAVALQNVTVPSQAVVDTHYAQENPSALMPSTTAGVVKSVARIGMVPRVWAPYLIQGGSPKETLDKIELLVAESPAEHRPAFESIQVWARYACVARSATIPGARQPAVAVAWRDFPRDAGYNAWAKARFSNVFGIRSDTPNPPAGGAPAPAMDTSHLAEAIITGMRGASEAERDKKEKFADHERMAILAACGLNPDQWDQVPPIYDKITKDGRTKAAVRAAMEAEYRETTLSPEIPSSVFLSTQLVSDVKDVNFGWQQNQAYASCHRGVSPFAVPHTSIESHSALRDLEEDAERATTTTLADVRAARTGPPACPNGYYSFLQMLGAYIKLLIMMFGAHCGHLAHVLRIHQIFHSGAAMYQRVSSVQVAHVLWSVFIDARTYFSTPHDIMGNPPESRLKYIVGLMEAGSLPTPMGTPLLSMFGNGDGPPNPLTTGGQTGAQQGGGTQTPANSGPPWMNHEVDPKIAAATAEAHRCSPTVNFRMVAMATSPPRPQLSTMQLCRGGCFDYHFFGRCDAKNCSWKHNGRVNDTKVEAVLVKMKPALAQFVSANS